MSSSSADHVVQDDDSALQQLKATLNKLYRLTIQDGRSFTGTLVCLDKELNVILSGTTEVNSEGEERDVGMVMVPWKWVVSAQVEVERRMSDGFSNGAAQSALYI